jgi:hypothetical protein
MVEEGEPDEDLTKSGIPLLDTPLRALRDLEERQEQTRSSVVSFLLFIFFFIVLATFISLWTNSANGNDLKDILAIIVPPTVSLLGAATAFYYAHRERSPR